jgi:hypothetical protein
MHAILWLENLEERDHSKDLGVEGRIIILEWLLGKQSGEMWPVCIWLTIGTSGGLS